MGVLQGLTRIEMNTRYPEICAEYERVGFYNQIPNGESAVERGLLAGFLEFVLDLPFGGSRGFAKSHTSLNHFDYSASGWRLKIWNDVTHLEDGGAAEDKVIAPGRRRAAG